LLLERHKKSDARSLASDFGAAPLGLKCLSEQHYARRRPFEVRMG